MLVYTKSLTVSKRLNTVCTPTEPPEVGVLHGAQLEYIRLIFVLAVHGSIADVRRRLPALAAAKK